MTSAHKTARPLVALNPADAEALRGRGYARLNQHEYDRAIEDLTAAIALNPSDALAFRFRSSAYAAKKESNRAHNDDVKARQLDRSAR
jgi:regulator of sirC expression with transglutaminase-like and TPR domain